MPSYCCFWCPANDFSERAFGDSCPSCGRAFNTVLRNQPKVIDGYSVKEGVSRGFYGAVYRAMQDSLRRLVVLKVVPKKVYEYFNKDWGKECQEHAVLAEGTPFVAQITDQFEATVSFGKDSLDCYVAVLENIDGLTLESVLASPLKNRLTPRMAAQVAADLFEILHLFRGRHRSHNDLHAGNLIIQRLSPQARRSGAIDANIRAVAIDFGSVLDASQSGDSHHVGDQQHAANIIAALSKAVREHSGGETDMDYRMASALRGLAEHLAPAATSQRIMSIDDARNTINAATRAVDEYWRQPLLLSHYGDAYNAQALESWHVPELWIDPEGKWFKRTIVRGPQVITGMRGCGKTMLLRALHFHARAVESSQAGSYRTLSKRFKKDGFLGIYASCQKLLNPQNQGDRDATPVKLPFERLFVAYLRDAVQVLRHLQDLDDEALTSSIDVALRDALKALELTKAEVGDAGDERRFEEFLIDLEFDLADGKSACRLKTPPTEAFAYLAGVITAAAPALARKYVLFLLDDVSTRYLSSDTVRDVISQLLFQHPRCAFRITTEAQALHRVLFSPGGGAPADSNRDYEEFDLGNEVYRLLQEGSTVENMGFVSEMLRRRGRMFQDALYTVDPKIVLDDVTLEDIANDIASSSATSSARKEVYRGLRALQAVCVGDLGDVVKLYEKILERATIDDLPVSAKKQTTAFLEHSNNLMHILNRRDQYKKSLALAFAQAAGQLLQRSGGGKAASGQRRLRQYTKLYVRVEAGSALDDVTGKLLDLVDAGVFVYDGGVPRTKTRDDDPVLQFKLSYRKILGLASFIGLADRDRFELSGDSLREWLETPKKAKRILVESEARRRVERELQSTPKPIKKKSAPTVRKSPPAPSPRARDGSASITSESYDPRGSKDSPLQLGLKYAHQQSAAMDLSIPALGVQAVSVTLDSLIPRKVDAVILAQGFEERTLVSAERLLNVVRPRLIIMVQYDRNQGKALVSLVRRMKIKSEVVTTLSQMEAKLGKVSSAIIDSSGLSKSYLFVAVRNLLKRLGRVTVVHTLAERYYPSNEDLHRIGVRANKQIPTRVFSRLDKVLSGEVGPYEMIQVHHEMASPERWRALLASASPKNDRLLHILDSRDYDASRILVPPPTTARRCLARAAAELSASVADENVALVEVNTNDIAGALQKSEEIYNELYYVSGANIEIGLTGSKVHAIAFAALAAAARVSAAWYVKPKIYDHARFTTGVGETHCFDLSLTSVI